MADSPPTSMRSGSTRSGTGKLPGSGGGDATSRPAPTGSRPICAPARSTNQIAPSGPVVMLATEGRKSIGSSVAVPVRARKRRMPCGPAIELEPTYNASSGPVWIARGWKLPRS